MTSLELIGHRGEEDAWQFSAEVGGVALAVLGVMQDDANGRADSSLRSE
jgi:hypothetical protein